MIATIDFETTGLKAGEDEVIAYNAAFEDSYIKAYGIEVDPENGLTL